jgi:hypothetical protein
MFNRIENKEYIVITNPKIPHFTFSRNLGHNK